jgi:tetratricopeptide (TPR) repeat protein
MKRFADTVSRLLGDRWVVVVEPSQNYRASIRQFLANLRVKNVKLVATCEEARKLTLQKKVGLYVVEWLTPGTNGLQFRKELLRSIHASDVPFLLLSMENLESDVVLASEVNIDGYLLKPFSYEDFSNKVTEVLSVRREPDTLETLLDEAEKALARKDVAAAQRGFNQALLRKPSSARAHTGLARMAFDAGNTALALDLVAKAQAANPEFLESYRLELRVHQARKDSTNVLRVAKKAHEMSPENPKYTMILAKTSLEAGDLFASEQFFKMTIAVSPKLAAAYKGLGDVYLKKDDNERSRRYYLKALDLDGEDIAVLNGLGTTCVRQGHFKEGINYYVMALKLDARNPKVKFNLGHAYEKLGEFDQALHYLYAALVDDPSLSKARLAVDRIKGKKAG